MAPLLTLEVDPSSHVVGSLGDPFPSLGDLGLSRSHFIDITEDTLIRKRAKTKYRSLIINDNTTVM